MVPWDNGDLADLATPMTPCHADASAPLSTSEDFGADLWHTIILSKKGLGEDLPTKNWLLDEYGVITPY